MSTSDDKSSAGPFYDVGVAIVPIWHDLDAERRVGGPTEATAIPGFDEATGRGRTHSAERGALLIERGQEAVQAATEAIAAQIGLAAHRIATEIGEQFVPSSSSGILELDSIDVSFGVTLTVGVQAMFTAQAESSVQVTITLTPQRSGSDSSKS